MCKKELCMRKNIFKISAVLFFSILTSCTVNSYIRASTNVDSHNSDVTSSTENQFHSLSSQIQNGIIFFKIGDKEVEQAKKGDEVTLSLVLLKGYSLKTISASEGVNLITVEEGKTYSFTMIDDDVTITAETEKKNSHVIKSISLLGDEISDFVGVRKDDSFFDDDKLSFSFKGKPQSDYRIVINKLKTLIPEENNGLYTTSYTLDNSIDDLDIVVSIWNKESETGPTISFEANDKLFHIYGIENSKKYLAENKSLSFYIIGEKGIKLSGSYLTDGASGLPLNIGEDGKTTITGISSSAKTLTLKIEGKDVGSQNVIIKDEDKNKVSVEGKTDNVLVGDTLTLKVKSVDTTKKIIGVSVKDNKGENISSTFTPNDYRLVFTMPSSDVTLTFEFAEKKPLSFYKDDGILKNVRFEIGGKEVTEAFPTDSVDVFPELNSGYTLESLTYQDGKTVGSSGSGITKKYSFIVPKEGDVLIKAVAKKTYSVTIKDSGEKHYSISSFETYAEGEKVSFTLSPNEGYTISKVLMNDSPLTSTNGKDYSFVMPNKDVVLTIETQVAKTTIIKYSSSIVAGAKLEVFDSSNKKIYDRDKVIIGSELTIKVTLEDGYVLDSVKLSDGTTPTKVSNTKYTFIVPEVDSLSITIEVSPIKNPKLTIQDEKSLFNFEIKDLTKINEDPANSSKYTSSNWDIANAFDKIPSGHKVRVTASPKDKNQPYDWKKATVDISDETLDKTIQTGANYSGVDTVVDFIMPTTDLSLKFSVPNSETTEENKTYNLALSTGTMKDFKLNFDNSNKYEDITYAIPFKKGSTLYLFPDKTKITKDKYDTRKGWGNKWYFELVDGRGNSLGKVEWSSYDVDSLTIKMDFSSNIYLSFKNDKDF